MQNVCEADEKINEYRITEYKHVLVSFYRKVVLKWLVIPYIAQSYCL